MSVYFFLAKDVAAVKIGYSGKPWVRLNVAQVNCPVPLTLVGVLSDRDHTEAGVQGRFADDHIRGDWFTLSPRLEAFINTLPTPEKIDRRFREHRAPRPALTT
jgi:hypothetical protein